MATLTTKYSVGDSVYYATTTTTKKRWPCPDCNGSKKWRAISPAGEEYEFACPRCANRFQHNDALSLEYSAHAPLVRALTIGSVRVDSHSDQPVTYMCVETGVGSGNVYYEDTLFAAREDAQTAAEVLAKERDQTVEWVAKRYNRTLELSDYQLSNAIKHDAEKFAREARYNVEDLLSSLDSAFDPDDVRRAIARWRGEDASEDARAA